MGAGILERHDRGWLASFTVKVSVEAGWWVVLLVGSDMLLNALSDRVGASDLLWCEKVIPFRQGLRTGLGINAQSQNHPR